jgi:hypothetical protein
MVALIDVVIQKWMGVDQFSILTNHPIHFWPGYALYYTIINLIAAVGVCIDGFLNTIVDYQSDLGEADD